MTDDGKSIDADGYRGEIAISTHSDIGIRFITSSTCDIVAVGDSKDLVGSVSMADDDDV